MLVASSACAVGLDGGRLAACGGAPNCVSSDASGPRGIAAFTLRVAGAQAWQALERVLADTPRVNIVARRGDYLHAEFVSALFRFIDDVEFQLRAQDGIIAVRSASRFGYYDFGANRSRVEKLRERLRAVGVVE
jgi:uncharacterized protein (DUF1499 family)